eukprot:GHVS01096714.1.p4 GENE.GHVS01096714.1~~GHVS01096714.1.p4  ORF type:complete len:106 (+),score=16.93 GHVS01096714.1:560-877(+)
MGDVLAAYMSERADSFNRHPFLFQRQWEIEGGEVVEFASSEVLDGETSRICSPTEAEDVKRWAAANEERFSESVAKEWAAFETGIKKEGDRQSSVMSRHKRLRLL